MPEGHTIHRIAKDHSPILTGQPVAVSSPQGRFEADAALIDGVVLDRIEPYGKHLFYWYANGLVGHVHLGLFGKFRVAKGPEVPPVQGLVRMRMSTDLGTIDLAGPTDCSIGTADERDATHRALVVDHRHLLWKRGHRNVKEVADAAAVQRRHRVGLP